MILIAEIVYCTNMQCGCYVAAVVFILLHVIVKSKNYVRLCAERAAGGEAGGADCDGVLAYKRMPSCFSGA